MTKANRSDTVVERETVLKTDYLTANYTNLLQEGDIITNWAEFERITMLKRSGTGSHAKARNAKVLASYYTWEKLDKCNKIVITAVHPEPLQPEVRGKYARYIEPILIDLLLDNCNSRGYSEIILTYNELFAALGMAKPGYTAKLYPDAIELSEEAQELLPLIDIDNVNNRCNKLAFDRMRSAVQSAKMQLHEHAIMNWETTYLVWEVGSDTSRLASTHEKVFINSCTAECIYDGILPFERSYDRKKGQLKVSRFKSAVLAKYHSSYGAAEELPTLWKYKPVHHILTTKFILNQVKSAGDNKYKLNFTILEMLLVSLYKEFSKTIVDNLSLEEYREEKQAGQSVIGIRSEEIEITNHIMKKKIELQQEPANDLFHMLTTKEQIDALKKLQKSLQ